MPARKIVQTIALKYFRAKFRLLSAVSKRKAAEKAFELFCTPQSRNNNKIPDFYTKAEKLQVTVEGNAVRGWRFNHSQPGDPGEIKTRKKVMILHGYESSVTNFHKYVKAFLKKDYEVLAFDAPGHGISGGKKYNSPVVQEYDQKNQSYLWPGGFVYSPFFWRAGHQFSLGRNGSY